MGHSQKISDGPSLHQVMILEQGIPEFQSLPQAQAATLGSRPKLWEGPAPLALPNTKPM
jgi:hypothetical protein